MYYKASGKIPPISILICIGIVLATAPVLALIYTYAVWYIPIIFISLLFTAGSGFALSVLIEMVGRKYKSRSKIFNVILALGGGIVLSYFNWAIWIDLVLNSGETYGIDGSIGITVAGSNVSKVINLLLHPDEMLQYATLINNFGTWSIKGTAVHGVVLSIVWVIEAAILIGLPVALTLFRETEPFCETGNEWAEKREAKHLYQFLEDTSKMKKDLENKNYEPVLNLKLKDENDLSYSKVYIYYAKANSIFYLSIKNFKAKVDKKNKVDFTESFVVENISISKETGLKLLSQ